MYPFEWMLSKHIGPRWGAFLFTRTGHSDQVLKAFGLLYQTL
jgi:hypothetical protein